MSDSVGESDDERGDVGSTCWAGVIGQHRAKIRQFALTPVTREGKVASSGLGERFQSASQAADWHSLRLVCCCLAIIAMCWLGIFMPCYRCPPPPQHSRGDPSNHPLPWNG